MRQEGRNARRLRTGQIPFQPFVYGRDGRASGRVKGKPVLLVHFADAAADAAGRMAASI